jgi:hypothetical protein
LPGKGYIDFEPYDYQQEYLNDDSTNRAINKARQTGMSTAVGAEVAWEITHIKGATVIILSKIKPPRLTSSSMFMIFYTRFVR